MEPAAPSSLLIVVHPGSLCGSLDMHLGNEADETRYAIAEEIENWPGPVAVVSGCFMDELERSGYRDLGRALDSHATYVTRGEPSDLGLKRAAFRIAKRFGLQAGAKVRITGAWNDKDGSGCVTAVANALKSRGIEAVISEHAPSSD